LKHKSPPNRHLLHQRSSLLFFFFFKLTLTVCGMPARVWCLGCTAPPFIEQFFFFFWRKWKRSEFLPHDFDCIQSPGDDSTVNTVLARFFSVLGILEHTLTAIRDVK
jgi:hypothetical protein